MPDHRRPSPPAERPPHPATVVQKRTVSPGMPRPLPPHPATVQRRAAPFGVNRALPPHSATAHQAIQRAAAKADAKAPALSADYHLAQAVDLSGVFELGIHQFVLSDDMLEVIREIDDYWLTTGRPRLNLKLYEGVTAPYPDKVVLAKYKTILNNDYPKRMLIPIAVSYHSRSDDAAQTMLYRIEDGRHRFIFYASVGFKTVPVRLKTVVAFGAAASAAGGKAK
jgi:hypothetical protein